MSQPSVAVVPSLASPRPGDTLDLRCEVAALPGEARYCAAIGQPAPILSCDWSPGGRARQPPLVQWTKLGSAELGPGAVTRGDTLRWVSRQSHYSFY